MGRCGEKPAGGIIIALPSRFGETRDMNPDKAVCPNCQAEVVFIHRNGIPQCPECGAAFGRVAEPADPGAAAMSVFKVICWVIVAMLAVAGITVAVVFVGCVVSLRNL
jgi:ribosomal protein L37AE/L43A